MHRREFLKTGTALALAGAMPRIARAQQSKIVFGGSVPMTGVAAETGLNVLRGYECAVKFINEEMGGVDVNGRAAIEWGVYGVPETFLVGPDGTIRYKHVGPLTPESILSELLPKMEKILPKPG